MKCNICNKRRCQCGLIEAEKMLIKPLDSEIVMIELGKDSSKKLGLGELFWRVSSSTIGLSDQLARLSLE